MHTFTTKGYDKNGKLVDSFHHYHERLQIGNPWAIARRGGELLLKNRKVKTVKYFMDGAEYAWNAHKLEWIPVGE